MKKSIKTIFIMLFVFVFVFALTLSYNAKAETYEEDTSVYDESYFDLYTDSDYLYNPSPEEEGYKIQDYKICNSIILSCRTMLPYRSSKRDRGIVYEACGNDQIVKIVPIELFRKEGQYLHIGEEYGFFVDTTKMNFGNCSVVFVFDIIKHPVDNPNFPSQYVIEIDPLFQYEYLYSNEKKDDKTFYFEYYQEPFEIIMPNNLSEIVMPLPDLMNSNNTDRNLIFSQIKKYFIKDVSFGLTVLNEQELNYGDNGYNPENDNGTFIARANMNYSGVGNKSLLGGSILNEFTSTLGFVPYVGTALSVVDYFVSLKDLIVNEENDFRVDDSYADLHSDQKYNTKLEQIDNYGQLNKSSKIQLNSDDKHPLLFGYGDHYIRGSFTLGMTDNWNTRVYDYIGLSVVSESTNIFTNESTITSRITSDRVTYTNIRDVQTKSVELEEQHSFSMLPNGMAQFEFDAKYASDYSICIPKSNQMKVFIDGGECDLSNDTINIYLSAGKHIFYIKSIYEEPIKSSIKIKTNSIAHSYSSFKQLNLRAGEQYLLKIADLSEVKTLLTSSGKIVDLLDENMLPYRTYGDFSLDNKVTYPFVKGNYYVVIKDDSTRKCDFSINQIDGIKSPGSISIKTNSNYYNYLYFTGEQEFSYFLTASNSSGIEAIILEGSTLKKISAERVSNLGYYLNPCASGKLYIGIKTYNNVSNKIFITKEEDSFKWKLSLGGTTSTVARGYTYNLMTGKKCTFSLTLNGRDVEPDCFSDKAYSTNNAGSYVYTIDDNSIKFDKYNSMTGGSGVRIVAKIGSNDVADITFIPQFCEEISSIINNITNDDTISFSYSVPKYTQYFEYYVYPNTTKIYKVEINPNETNGTVDLLKEVENGNINKTYFNTSRNINVHISNICYIDANGNKIVYEHQADSKTVNSLFKSGNGSSSDPYKISCYRHFENMALYSTTTQKNNLYYSLSCDIQAIDWDTAIQKRMKDIAYNKEVGICFYGVLEGNYHKITMTIHKASNSGYAGMFAINYGKISNIKLKIQVVLQNTNSNMLNVGAFAGVNESVGELINCDVYSYIGSTTTNDVSFHTIDNGRHLYNVDIYIGTTDDVRVGGIVGTNYGKLDNCDNFGLSIFSRGDIGGIVGVQESGSIKSCWNYGRIYYLLMDIGDNRSIGGIVGWVVSGEVSSSRNCAIISYDNEVVWDKRIYPNMGQIAGRNQGNITGSVLKGKVDVENLVYYGGFLGIGKYDQKAYAENREIGRQG